MTCLLLMTAAALGPAQPREYKKAAGPHEVEARKLPWRDEARSRDVPVKLYCPKAGKGPFPVIVFSHGLGGTRDGYAYLGRHWASHGYVCLHLQHKGSDDAVWKGSLQPLAAMRKAVRDPANARNRVLDVRLALDRLAELNRDDPALRGRLDLDRVGMAGHSFGAWTTQAVIGGASEKPDPRVKAAVILSPSRPRGGADPDRAFAAVAVPCLHMTGTEDGGAVLTDVKPADRRVPYDHMKKSDQYLVIFKGGDHMVFALPRPRPARAARDARMQDVIRMATTAFWDAYLKGDPAARAWLQEGGLRQALGGDGTLEQKRGAK